MRACVRACVCVVVWFGLVQFGVDRVFFAESGWEGGREGERKAAGRGFFPRFIDFVGMEWNEMPSSTCMYVFFVGMYVATAVIPLAPPRLCSFGVDLRCTRSHYVRTRGHTSRLLARLKHRCHLTVHTVFVLECPGSFDP